MYALLDDLRMAARTLSRSRGFAVIAVLSLGIAIAATTAVFSVIDAVRFRPLPFANPERLVLLDERDSVSASFARCPTCVGTPSFATVANWRAQSASYSGVGFFAPARFDLRHEDEDEYLPAARVSPGLLALLGVRPLLGREFVPADTLPGAEPVVLLDYDFWRGRLGGDESVVGKALEGVDPATRQATTARVIAVLPKGFHLRGLAAVWMPLRVPSHPTPASSGAYVIARLMAGVTPTAANAELATISRRLALQDSTDYRRHGGAVLPLRALFSDPSVGAGSRELFAIMAIVLLIAAANVAGLFLVRAEARRHELAVRGALGASRPALVRLLLAEAFCLAAAGGTAGVLLAIWAVRIAGVTLGSNSIGLVARVDLRVLAFAGTVSFVVGLTMGLLPAVGAARSDLFRQLRSRRHDRAGRSGWSGRALVLLQTAGGLSLLVVAASLGREFVRLRYQAPGFDPHRLYMVGIRLPGSGSTDVDQLRLAAATARERMASLPGVASAAIEIPGGPEQVQVSDDGEVIPMAKSPLFHAVDATFFHDVGIPIMAGRAFSADDRVGAPQVAIINEAAAYALWPGQRVIGHRLLVGDGSANGSWLTVVGVAGDAKLIDVFSAGPYRPVIYRPFQQAPIRGAWLLVRTKGDSAQAMRSVIAVQREFTNRPYTRGTSVLSLEEGLDSDLRRNRIEALSIDTLAAFALVLVGIGVYGVVAYDATRRTHEFGIRIALGAGRQEVLTAASRTGLTIAVIGIGLGVAATLALGRVARALVPSSEGVSLSLLGGAAFVMLVAIFVATYLPARRATTIDPMEAIRID